MEGIVVGIAQINFHQKLKGISNDCNPTKVSKNVSTSMSFSDRDFSTSDERKNANSPRSDNGTIINLGDVEKTSNSWEEIEDNLERDDHGKKSCTLAERRKMPSRASKESCLLGIKRRTITKPTKRTKINENIKNLRPSDIRKIYLNKKLSKFRPSSLETIFEETSIFNNHEAGCSRLMGDRKIKRSLSFTDGFRHTKTLVNKRRAKIKKTFGKRFALKKISLEEFLEKLNTSMENTEEAAGHDCQMVNDKNEVCKEHCLLNSSENSDSANIFIPNEFPTNMSP